MNKERIVWIDGARGLAMLMVVLVHAAGQMHNLPSAVAFLSSWGNMGVQLFFLLSAYSACLADETSGRGNKALSVYYIKRFMRLAPLYWFGILLYFFMALNGVICGGPASNYTPANVLVNLLLINNLFPAAQNYIVPGGWCISCFAFFYLLFPLLNRFLKSRALFKTVIVCIAGAAVSVALFSFTKLPAQYLYWLLPNQIGVFLIGMLYYRNAGIRRMKWIGAQLAGALILAVVAVILIQLIGYRYTYQHILAALSFILVLNALRRYEVNIPGWMAYFGKLSYPVFIIHFAVSWAVITLAGGWLAFLPSVLQLAVYVALIASLSLLLAAILSRAIDDPASKFTRWLIARVGKDELKGRPA